MAKIQLTDKQYLELGKKIVTFYEMGYVDKKTALTFAFLKGVAGGFGAFLGGTILIALILWLLSLLGHIPFVDEIAQSVQKTLE